MTRKILILGGTGEAADVAGELADRLPGATIITSMAGATKAPRDVPGVVVTGGFGGIQGLKAYIENEAIDLVIDATHPFAETISDNAYVACTVSNIPRVQLLRPQWDLPPNGKWVEVDSLEDAAEAAAQIGSRVFVTTGARNLEAFAGFKETWFLVRLIEEPPSGLPIEFHDVIIDRPPFSLDGERALMRKHNIDCLVSKHSGGARTEGKIQAALSRGIPIVLLRRPVSLPGNITESVDECVTWVQQQLG